MHTAARLLVQPRGPLVGHELIVEVVVRGHVRHEGAHLRRHVILDEPELHAQPVQKVQIFGMKLVGVPPPLLHVEAAMKRSRSAVRLHGRGSSSWLIRIWTCSVLV